MLGHHKTVVDTVCPYDNQTQTEIPFDVDCFLVRLRAEDLLKVAKYTDSVRVGLPWRIKSELRLMPPPEEKPEDPAWIASEDISFDYKNPRLANLILQAAQDISVEKSQMFLALTILRNAFFNDTLTKNLRTEPPLQLKEWCHAVLASE